MQRKPTCAIFCIPKRLKMFNPMIRAAYLPLSLAIIITATLPLPAQVATSGGDTEAAVHEAVRRQALTIELREKLGEAVQAEQRKDPMGAVKIYQHCVDLCRSIGSGVDSETRTAVNGVVRIRSNFALQAQKLGQYKEADTQFQAALSVDPKNQVLLAMKEKNDALLAAQVGRIPSDAVLAEVPGLITNKTTAATLVQDGKLLYELGKWDEAEAKLEEAIKEDPNNKAGAYYMNLIQEARFSAASRQREVDARKQVVEIENAWVPDVQREMLPVPNPYARTNLIHTGAGRQKIVSKLNRIELNEVKYDGLELSEVIKNLSEEAKKRDPDKEGINFIIMTDNASQSAGVAPGATDPNTGLPAAVALPAAEPVDVGSIRIKINPALDNVRLADVLDAIVKTAEKPIKYSVEDYAIVFSVKTPEAEPLYTRTFKVDPNTFYQGLESVGALSFGDIQTGNSGSGGSGGGSSSGNGQNGTGSSSALIARVTVAGGGGQNGGGGGGQSGGNGTTGDGISFVTKTNFTETVNTAVRAFFTAAGVDFGTTLAQNGAGGARDQAALGANGGGNANQKALFFNDRKGILFVRATMQDLDIIEQAIQTLNVTPPQVNIRAKIAEVNQDDSRALGFDWFLGNTAGNSGSVGFQGGTAPSYSGSDPNGNNGASTIFPNPPIPASTTDQLITGGLRNSLGAPVVGTVTGILTDPQFRVAITALEQRGGVDVLSAPSVTTVSGRQAHIEVTDVETIITGLNANQTGSGGSGGTGTTVSTGGTGAVGSTIQPTSQALPFGPMLDVIPYVSADEYTVQMTIIPTVTEFIGYDQSSFSVQAQGSQGSPLIQSVPLPHFRTRQITTTLVVWDGQTVVMGGLISSSVTRTKDKVPVIGDLPLLGRLFRSESNESKKKNLVIFVTPTIIDPAGNRMHSDEEMPFSRNSFPLQRPIAPVQQ